MQNQSLIAINLFCLLVAVGLYGEQRFLAEPRIASLELKTTQHSSQLSSLELRQTNQLQYLESRINDVDAKVDDNHNDTAAKLKILESRIQQSR